MEARIPDVPSGSSKRSSRRQIRSACGACVRRKVRCDGARPVCTACSSQGVQGRCQYDTKDGNETRSSALKRERESLKTQLASLGQDFDYLLQMSDEDALRLLRKARKFANPIAALAALPDGASLHTHSHLKEHRISKAIVSPTSQSHLEHELAVTYPQAFMPLPVVNVRSLNGNLHWSLPMPKESAIEGSMVFRTRSITATSTTTSTNPPIMLASQPSQPLKPPAYSNPGLRYLQVAYWTNVPVSSEFASRSISRYLAVNHVFNTCFDRELFLSDLLSRRERYCSRLLVNSILYVSCLGYADLDPTAHVFRPLFQAEVEEIWKTAMYEDSLLNLAVCNVLINAYVWDSQDAKGHEMAQHAADLAARLDLDLQMPGALQRYHDLSPSDARTFAFVAWGNFCNTTLVHLDISPSWTKNADQYNPRVRAFYWRQNCPMRAPLCGIPDEHLAGEGSEISAPVSTTFVSWCKFHTIMLELAQLYNASKEKPLSESVTPAAAEGKYRDLLKWSQGLRCSLEWQSQSPFHVVLLQIYFHTAVMDIFRPLLGCNVKLNTFSASDSSPETAFVASLNQLKRLMLVFLSRYPEAKYCVWIEHVRPISLCCISKVYMLMNTRFEKACVYVANAVLQDSSDPEWRFYFMLCLHNFFQLDLCYPHSRTIILSMLSMAVDRGMLSMREARQKFEELQQQSIASFISLPSKFVVDQYHDNTDLQGSTGEALAARLESELVFDGFTNAA